MSKKPGLVSSTGSGAERRRLNEVAAIVDHCKAALAIANARGDKFLSYMIEMTIQAAEASMGTKR